MEISFILDATLALLGGLSVLVIALGTFCQQPKGEPSLHHQDETSDDKTFHAYAVIPQKAA